MALFRATKWYVKINANYFSYNQLSNQASASKYIFLPKHANKRENISQWEIGWFATSAKCYIIVVIQH